MDRRRVLTALAAGAVTTTAGCGGIWRSGTSEPSTQPTTKRSSPASGRTAPDPARVDGSLPVSTGEFARSTAPDAIPAITDPAFGDDWRDLDHVGTWLIDNDPIIGVDRSGTQRAYPLRVLNWHEVVNDTLGGPLLVTYCPLCRSGVVARRLVDGEPTVFGVSGLLWRGNNVLYDRRTGSLWSQLAARAIRGPMTGQRLELVPSTLTTWQKWRQRYPGSAVLLPPPHSTTVASDSGSMAGIRDYANGLGDLYGSHDGLPPKVSFDDDRLSPKAMVVGVQFNETARAYPLRVLAAEQVINDTVGEVPVVVAAGGASTASPTLVAYVRVVAGTELRFSPIDEEHMAAGGSRWTIDSGRAIDGPYEGVRLRRANEATTMFWFAWLGFHRETSVYSAERQ